MYMSNLMRTTFNPFKFFDTIKPKIDYNQAASIYCNNIEIWATARKQWIEGMMAFNQFQTDWRCQTIQDAAQFIQTLHNENPLHQQGNIPEEVVTKDFKNAVETGTETVKKGVRLQKDIVAKTVDIWNENREELAQTVKAAGKKN